MSAGVRKALFILTVILAVSCSKQIKIEKGQFEREMQRQGLVSRVQELYFNLNGKNLEAVWEMAGPNIRSEKKEDYIARMKDRLAKATFMSIQDSRVVEIDHPLAIIWTNVFYNSQGQMFFICEKSVWRFIYDNWYFVESGSSCDSEITSDQRSKFKQ